LNKSDRTYKNLLVDDHLYLPYYRPNTGKEVILIFMSSYHSEVAAA